MPELPEVEIMTRLLRRRLHGQRIRRLEVCDPKIRLPADVAGARVTKIWRRAKFIILSLSTDSHLLVHLRMTGWFDFQQPERYRLALHTGVASAYFTDSRRFGTVELLGSRALAARFAALGPEPLARGANLAQLRATTRSVKVALLDQRLIAGVGNIYACESLWRARINPRRRADRLDARQLFRLQRCLTAALRKGLGYGARIFDVQEFYAYDRAGRPCRRCGTAIRRITQAQRSTFFCPRCQRT